MKTTKMKKVLIAIDYDPTSQKVAEVGFTLAKTMNAEIVLLHVIAEPLYYSTSNFSPIMGFEGYMNSNPALLNSLDGLKEITASFLEKTKKHLGDESITTIIKDGDLSSGILSAAKETHADIIVIGSHSRSWLEKILLGSVAESVINDSKTPILIVPTKKA